MQSFEITDRQTLRNILETFSTFDQIRWNYRYNYDLINYSHSSNEITPEEQLLTHWLCFIVDRQMSFQRIWDIGGYIFSDIVYNYSRKSQKSIRELENTYITNGKNGEKRKLSTQIIQNNSILEKYGFYKKNKNVEFSSRYFATDAICILKTLLILEKHFNRSFGEFLYRVIEDSESLSESIIKLAMNLELLTYDSIGTVTNKSYKDKREEIEKTSNDFTIIKKDNKWKCNRKRLWCAVRDYLKSPEFNEIFVETLIIAGFGNADDYKRTNADLLNSLDVLELPGDVWNNSTTFRNGLFDPYIKNTRKTWTMPKVIRKIYNQLNPLDFYPEQLDVSFDFVPRMCERKMCDICIFGDGIDTTCHKTEGKYCSVALYSFGYRYKCDPNSCKLFDNREQLKNVCKKRTDCIREI